MSVANNGGKSSGNAKKHLQAYICFIDYTNAFDRVKHDIIFEILSKPGEINMIKSL